MALNLDSGDYKIFRDGFRKFVQKEIAPHYLQWEKEGRIPREIWQKAGENGYLCPWVEEKYGGTGAGFEYSVIIAEELARAGTLILFPLHSDIVVPYIHSYGTEAQKQKWLPGCVSGDLIRTADTQQLRGPGFIASRAVQSRDDHFPFRLAQAPPVGSPGFLSTREPAQTGPAYPLYGHR
ncbi:MAG: acyl-CoA dehydrogenase [Thermoanaerobacter sp.]|nr:acyl-CoA dehydrogenase [Thermoanaerobacter sp.]